MVESTLAEAFPGLQRLAGADLGIANPCLAGMGAEGVPPVLAGLVLTIDKRIKISNQHHFFRRAKISVQGKIPRGVAHSS